MDIILLVATTTAFFIPTGSGSIINSSGLSFSDGGGSTYSSYTSSIQYTIPTLNSSCSRTSDCRSDRYHTYLTCIKGNCGCDSHTFFDSYDGMCRIKYPSQCKIKRNRSDQVQPCVRHSYCAFPLDHEGNELTKAVHGTCQCTIYKIPNVEDGTCTSGSSNTAITLSFPFSVVIFIFLLQSATFPEVFWSFSSASSSSSKLTLSQLDRR